MRCLAALALAVSLAVAGPPEAAPDDPVVLVVDGEEVRSRRYEDWLLRQAGEKHARTFGLRAALRACLDLAGDDVAREHLDAARAEQEARIDGAFGGRREGFERELAELGRTPDGRRVERALELELAALLARAETELRLARRELEAELRVDPLPALFPGADEGPIPSDAPVLGVVAPPCPDGPDDPLLVRRHAFGTWLRRYRGEVLAPRFVEELRVRRAAAGAEVSTSPDAIRARVVGDVDRAVAERHGGDRERWLAELARAGRTEAQYLREMTRKTELDLLVEALIRRDRTVTDAEVARAWEARHGPGGVLRELRWIRLDPEPLPPDPERGPEETARLAAAALERERALARDLRARLLAGEDFATLARQHSDDEATRLAGGRPDDDVRAQELPAPLRGPVEALAPGEVTAPIEHDDAIWLLECLAVRVTPLAQVADQLRRELLDARPADVEVAARRNALAQNARLELLPALVR